MPIRVARFYVDTSVIGGCLDQEFESASNRLVEECRAGAVRLIISDILIRELEQSPIEVRDLFAGLPDAGLERAATTPEVLALRDEYMAAGVLGPRWLDDAAHVAVATLAVADALVSWNFRHLVRLDKVRQFNAVNLRLGYPAIEIRSPREVIREDQDV